MIDDEVRRARKLLGTLVKISGLNRQEVDGRLGQGRGYASQVLTGRVELKYRHILTFLEVVGVDPGMFFRVLFAEFPPASEPREETSGRMAERLFRQLHRTGYAGRLPPSPLAPASPASPTAPAAPPTQAGIDPEVLERRIRQAIREVLGGGEPPDGLPDPDR